MEGTKRQALIRLKDPSTAESKDRVVARTDLTDSTRVVQKGVLEPLTAEAADAALAGVRALGATISAYYDQLGIALIEVPAGGAERLASSPYVDFIEPAGVIPTNAVPSSRPGAAISVAMSSMFVQTPPWGIDTMRASLAWPYSVGAGAKLLVIDFGYRRGHEDLPLIPTTNCLGAFGGCDDSLATSEQHGTHVLGTAAALNNSVGVVGVAPGIGPASIWSWGACSPFAGGCVVPEIVAALNWAAANLKPRGVVNMSLGGPIDYSSIGTAVAAAIAQDVLVVASGGNYGVNQPNYPASYANVIGVSGLRQNKTFALNDNAPCPNAGDQDAPGSNWGSHIDLSAPWDAISTVGDNQYQGPPIYCGTSMAAAHVSGLAALVRGFYPSGGWNYVWTRLKVTARDLGTYGRDDYYGWGMPRYLAVGFDIPVITASIVANKPRITWPAVPHATSYQVWRWVTPNAATAVLWATVSGATYTDTSTPVTSFYGYNMFPNPSTISVSYQVVSIGGEFEWAGAYATYIPNGIPPY